MAKVKIPPDDEIENLKNAVSERHPSLRDVWMTMDGLKLYLEQKPKNTMVGNMICYKLPWFLSSWINCCCCNECAGMYS